MAELIGLVASILTLVQVTAQTLKFANDLRNAPTEIRNLQEELINFSKVIHEINAFRGDRQILGSLVESELLASKNAMVKLHNLVDTSLARNGKAGRRWWTKINGRLKQSKLELGSARNRLLLGLVASNAISSSQTLAKLNSISRQVSANHKSNEMLRHTLQKVCSQSYSNELLFQQPQNATTAPHGILDPDLALTTRALIHEDPEISTSRLKEMCCSRRLPAPKYEQYAKRSSITDDDHQFHKRLPEPRGLFETMSGFLPTEYTLSARPKVTVIAMIERSCSAVQRINEYQLVLSRAPRHWVSVKLTVTTHQTSRYWKPFRIAATETTTSNSLPKPFERQLEAYLSSNTNVSDHSAIAFTGDDNFAAREKSSTHLSLEPMRDLLTFVRDLGCPVYSEREVSPLHALPRYYTWLYGRAAPYLSSLPDGALSLEIRVLPQDLDLEEMKWKLSFLQSLQSSPFVLKLLGVVTNNTYGYIKSILTSGVGRSLYSILSTKSEKFEIPLAVRLQWAKQIVTGVRDIHAKGFVVGQFRLGRFFLSSEGHIQLCDCRRKSKVSELRPVWLAPEMETPSPDFEVTYTSRTDMFQLGLVLWLLVQHSAHVACVGICPIPGCQCFKIGYIPGHAPVIDLPAFNKSVPTWYKSIVTACRAETPADRLPASKLLLLFPESEQVAVTLPPGTHEVSPSCCDKCYETVLDYYHCKVCENGDYDLCHACFEAGEHCQGKEHFLEEIKSEEGLLRSWCPTGRLFSEVKEGGRREVIEFT